MHFNTVFYEQNTVTRSLGRRILRFNRETKLQKECKNYPKIHGQTKKGGRTIAPPPWIRHWFLSRELCLLIWEWRIVTDFKWAHGITTNYRWAETIPYYSHGLIPIPIPKMSKFRTLFPFSSNSYITSQTSVPIPTVLDRQICRSTLSSVNSYLFQH